MVQERIAKLRENMKAAGIDCYLIPTSDYHDSEYVSGFFQVRKYFSGFTGSAGTLVAARNETALFTDGRYFIQAEKELKDSGIRLMKMEEPGVPTLLQYLEQVLQEGECLGFDGRVVKAESAREYEEIINKKNGKMIWDKDLSEGIWEERPAITHHPVFVLEECYSGESASSKIARVREKMKEEGCTMHILTSLDDIAWLLNIRGNDVESCPVVLSYIVMTMEQVILFAEGEKSGVWTEDLKKYLAKNNVTLRPYDSFYAYIPEIHKEKVLLCKERVSCRLLKELSEDVNVVDKANPTSFMKAVKNQVEMENLRKAHLKDAIAVTRFMHWLKTNVGKEPMTEVSAAVYLEDMRKENEHFIEPSFGTICAYGANGAIVHYSAKEDACAEIKQEGFLMVDSGGHYLEGTTDITRTFALGALTKEMKEHFTLVLKAMLNLRATKFLYGCRGINLDIRAREVFWENGLDYKHGTGHGVGYLLNVHEGPNSFRWKAQGEHLSSAVLEEGMVTTDEPGIYIEGSYGIRIENELLCRKGKKNDYGQFMYFEDLTYVPIDLDGVEVSMLEDRDKERLNGYHQGVYEKLAPYFEGEMLNWLRKVTAPVK
ncbi:aminopeptidase P family protein [Parablautia muri]|uniref:Aminopeptidase P family protein n=1 Tax=Parablautia muri TaxID=2320879 RepID=A0A9X5BHS8_9FIRM|nr:aminopeptidase P family protein [Parablautia muri]NBJ93157.1 aminopeptidase P family protein [Parablautia muri]